VRDWSAKKRERPDYDEIKKKFFNVAVKNKSRLPVGHPAKTVLISELFEEVFEKEVEESKWENFLNVRFEEYKRELQYLTRL